MRRVVTLKLCRWGAYISVIYLMFVICTYVLQPLENESSSLERVHPWENQMKVIHSINSSANKPEAFTNKDNNIVIKDTVQFKFPVDPIKGIKHKSSRLNLNNRIHKNSNKISERSDLRTKNENWKLGKILKHSNNKQLNQVPVNDEQKQDLISRKDYDGNKLYTENEMKEIDQEMKLRNKRVADVCTKNGIGGKRRGGQRTIRYPPSANYEVLYIDRPDALSFCPVYKAASTTWLNIFCILAGVKESTLSQTKEQISHFSRRIWPALDNNEASMAVPYTTKFMIVRHPFERIVSAYRDKLENINIGLEHGVMHFYEKYGKKIVEKYRNTDQFLSSNPSILGDSKLPKPRGVEPTFKEFVQYLIDTDLVLYADDHWIPYYLFCTPCYISYDVIGKFETLERDQKYLLQKLNLVEKVHPKWKHLTKGLKTSEVVKKYMKSLDRDLILKLAEKYQLDFDMYGYSYHEYL